MIDDKRKNDIKFGDVGTKERHDRKELGVLYVNDIPKAVVKKISPLHTYYQRGHIDSTQYSAGLRLYQSYVNAWVGIKSCEYREITDGGGSNDTVTEKQVRAIKDFKTGIIAAGKFEKIITDVCIHEKFIASLIEDWRKRKDLKSRLKEGLDNIARAYGYA